MCGRSVFSNVATMMGGYGHVRSAIAGSTKDQSHLERMLIDMNTGDRAYGYSSDLVREFNTDNTRAVQKITEHYLPGLSIGIKGQCQCPEFALQHGGYEYCSTTSKANRYASMLGQTVNKLTDAGVFFMLG